MDAVINFMYFHEIPGLYFMFIAPVTQSFILTILANATGILINEMKLHFAPSIHII